MRTSRIVRPLAIGLLVLLALLPACTSQDEQSLAGLINGARASSGLPALTLDAEATEIAREWSTAMANGNTLDHNPSLGTAVSTRIGSSWSAYGENVAYDGSYQGVFDAWMASSGHRDNILSSNFDRVGLGVVQRNGSFWVTAVFVGY